MMAKRKRKPVTKKNPARAAKRSRQWAEDGRWIGLGEALALSLSRIVRNYQANREKV